MSNPFYVVKFVMCVCTFGASFILDKSYKCNYKVFCFILLIVGICSWELLSLENVYCQTK